MARFTDCFFEPWVGSRYCLGVSGHRVLVLGESHYGDCDSQDPRAFTSGVVQRFAIDGPTIVYFTIVYRLLTNEPIPSREVRQAFWHSVAFYNYVQCFVGTGSRQRPTASDWATGKTPFKSVLEALKPHSVVVLGRELLLNLQDQHLLTKCEKADVFRYTTTSSHVAVLGAVKHPTSGFSYARWRPTVGAMFQETARLKSGDAL